MSKNEQPSPVYGLFFVGDGDERLLGVYTSEEAGRKALEEYVDCMQDYTVAALTANRFANWFWWYLNGAFR